VTIEDMTLEGPSNNDLDFTKKGDPVDAEILRQELETAKRVKEHLEGKEMTPQNVAALEMIGAKINRLRDEVVDTGLETVRASFPKENVAEANPADDEEDPYRFEGKQRIGPR
jgi:hypothetical protein